MPTIRKLRNKNSNLFDDEFADAEEDPFAVSATMIPSRCSSSSGPPLLSTPVFECDKNLPDKGIEPGNQHLLLQLLDTFGGPQASTKKTRIVSKICKQYPERFGVTGSDHRKRTKWLVDRWKQDDKFALTRQHIYAAGHIDSQPSFSFPDIQTSQPATKPTPAKARVTEPIAPVSPPTIKKKKTTSIMVKPFGSPLRLLRAAAGGAERGNYRSQQPRILSCLVLCLTVLLFVFFYTRSH